MSSLWSRHTARQLKLAIPGLLVTYYLGTLPEIWGVYYGQVGTWPRSAALICLVNAFITIGLFIYVLLTPLIKGVEPDFRSWRKSGLLSRVIPVLTASMVTGWLALVFTLGQWSRLGFGKGLVGACGLYATVFGMLGLLPAPKVRRA
ncbi:hypothetical protein M378DRAFT_73345 [Amanita muscaria Koide BX008]|uniref:Uncharacterized protein n=1 Tax=Amanita muscaria (strain Koide BX008) TaxID=946122 RepID=A0A0C2X0H2_AMAMK|nr:hypothetical protein M378DRAFT_73345 [Amanita muscaria Koide BX008]